MATLVAIGYPDETTALSAMDEAERLQHELVIQADAVAATQDKVSAKAIAIDRCTEVLLEYWANLRRSERSRRGVY